MKAYERFSEVYHDHWGDRLVRAYVPLIESAVKKYDVIGRTVLDVSCGTGNLLGARFTCVGSDLSEEMVAIAKQRYPDIPFLVNDMVSIRADRQFDIVLNTFNAANYLLSEDEMTKMFRTVKKIVSDNGIYILDFSTEKLYLNNFEGRYIHNISGLTFEQRCEYDPIDRMARTTLIYEDGQQEIHEQRAYTRQALLEMIRAGEYEILEAFGNFDMSPQTDESLRYVFILR